MTSAATVRRSLILGTEQGTEKSRLRLLFCLKEAWDFLFFLFGFDWQKRQKEKKSCIAQCIEIQNVSYYAH